MSAVANRCGAKFDVPPEERHIVSAAGGMTTFVCLNDKNHEGDHISWNPHITASYLPDDEPACVWQDIPGTEHLFYVLII